MGRQHRAFDIACRRAIGEVMALGFVAGGWLGLIDQLGAAGAARQLLAADKPLPVFYYVVGIGHSELCLEGMVVQDEWASLFTPSEREEAWRRLESAGVKQEGGRR